MPARKGKRKAAKKSDEFESKDAASKASAATAGPPPNSDDEEELKRVLEMSLQSAVEDEQKRKQSASAAIYIDSDEELKKAIEMSLLDSTIDSTTSGESSTTKSATAPTTSINCDKIGDGAGAIPISSSDDESEKMNSNKQAKAANNCQDEVPEQSNVPVRAKKGKGARSKQNPSPILIEDDNAPSSSCDQSSKSNGGAKNRGDAPSETFVIDSNDDDSELISDNNSPDCDQDEDYSDDDYHSDEEDFNSTCDLMFGSGHNFFRRGGGAGRAGPIHHQSSNSRLTSEAATKRMGTVFRKGLESKLNAQQMEPCKAIMTKLHPHQKAALAWMCNQENKETQGMIGGILGDDMGLGKTLTMLSLICTNHYDGRPLAKPSYGYVRPPTECGRRKGGKARTKSLINPTIPTSTVGKKLAMNKKTPFNFFSQKTVSSDEEKSDSEVVPFTYSDEEKSSRRKKLKKNNFIKDDDETESESGSDDDFDLMVKKSTTSLRNKFVEKKVELVRDPEEEDLDDFYEKWQKMTQEEKDAKFKSCSTSSLDPKFNLDGAFDDSESDSEQFGGARRKKSQLNSVSSDEEENVVSSGAEKRKKTNGVSSSGGEPRKRRKIVLDSDSDVNLSDLELDQQLSSSTRVTSLSKKNGCEAEEASEAGPSNSCDTNRIIPPKEPAVRGNRPRPTLIVCPTSLISHWCSEINTHVDPSVHLKVFIHHGSTKASIGEQLNTNDIVITTYGTLAAEYDAENSPLLRAKWLRVVLDEGHYIKNHRTKTAKAANELKTKRRWVVTGTPIQNNLMELWSLVNWLQFDLYADDQAGFKNQIERPCKARLSEGFERLQVLMDAICLRRTKADKKANGEPIVQLPSKTIITRDVNFTDEEKVLYLSLKKQYSAIVERYMRRGQLLKNYAHIFVLMLRLRQMCCHRELIFTIDWNVALQDKSQLERELARMEEAENNLAGVGGVDPDSANNPDRAKQLAEHLQKLIKEGIMDDCSVCLDNIRQPVITPCAHVYCRGCIEMVIQTRKPPCCPLCRSHLKKSELLEASTTNEEGEEKDAYEVDTLKDLEKINFDLSSSKVNAVMKEVLRIRQNNGDEKMVIVSQFTSFFSILQPLLTQNEFRFVRLDGTMTQMDRKETLEVFQAEGPHSPTVLLLSLKAGGVGLNLTAANHLLLLDPAWNPAAEWQCFDRIHRLGQKKEVFIYKFITRDDSIEESMLQIQEKKRDLITGAFHMADDERRRQRINDILTIFNLAPGTQQQQPQQQQPQQQQ